MTFGLDPSHARALWDIGFGIVIAQYLWRAAMRHWRMSAWSELPTEPRASAHPTDRGEFRLAILIVLTIGMIWAHFAPDVSHIAFPNQWP